MKVVEGDTVEYVGEAMQGLNKKYKITHVVPIFSLFEMSLYKQVCSLEVV